MIDVIDLEKGEQMFKGLNDRKTNVYWLDLKCDGNLLLYSGNRSMIEIFDIRKGEMVQDFNGINKCNTYFIINVRLSFS